MNNFTNTTQTIISTQRNKFQAFPFHLVEQSPWPIVTSLTLLTTTTSAVAYFQGFAFGGELFLLGILLTASVMALWFRDVVTEATYLGDHTSQVQSGLSLGFILFVISEVMAFFSVFWSFFHSSLAPTIEIGGNWPPVGIEALDPFAIPLLNTILLLSSGAFITWGHHALIQGNRSGAITGTFITIILAIVFTALQGVEYHEAPFSFADSVYGTTFFASTGLHGLHVIVGTIFILVGFARIISYHLTDSHHNGFEAAILYWHFVDVVWIFLFISVYYWGS
jgi:cytochrome c oxidase subunit 3